METVATVTHHTGTGASTVFDYLVSARGAGWYRHDFDSDGAYDSVAPCEIDALRDALQDASPASLIIELRCAAAALDQTSIHLLAVAEDASLDGDLDTAELLSDQASHLQHDRLLALEAVMTVCDEAWDSAVARVNHAHGENPEALPSALRTIELLWSSRQAVRDLVGRRRRVRG